MGGTGSGFQGRAKHGRRWSDALHLDSCSKRALSCRGRSPPGGDPRRRGGDGERLVLRRGGLLCHRLRWRVGDGVRNQAAPECLGCWNASEIIELLPALAQRSTSANGWGWSDRLRTSVTSRGGIGGPAHALRAPAHPGTNPPCIDVHSGRASIGVGLASLSRCLDVKLSI